MGAANLLDDPVLKEQLGDRYDELHSMVNKAKDDLLRVAQLAKQAIPLQIKMQHAYTYSKWDSIHEPYNVVENVLKDDESVYKGLTPDLDFTVNTGGLAYIAEVSLWPGDCGPANVELYWSNTSDKWTLAKSFTLTKSGEQKMVLPGEIIAKYMRLRCINNVRGGNLVNIRFIQIKGLSKFGGSGGQ
jgi:hypothetical protein